MLAARIATAAVLLCGFLFALFGLGRLAFAGVVALIVLVASLEWARLVRGAGWRRWAYASSVTVGYAGLLGLWFSGYSLDGLFAFSAVFWLLVAPAWMARGVRADPVAALWLAGPVVIVPAAIAMVQLHPGPLLAALALPWVADTAAYFAGRRWGRRKLAPSVSPGKTVEGAIAGLAAVIAYAMICAHGFPALSPVQGALALSGLVLAALVLGVLSILGDLFESAVKRQAGAKDSGTLLPGHGGVLDRIDSATSTLPVAALMHHFWLS